MTEFSCGLYYGVVEDGANECSLDSSLDGSVIFYLCQLVSFALEFVSYTVSTYILPSGGLLVGAVQ